MAFPSDIKLPSDARYFTFVETSKKFNSNYDITWSFEYSLPATNIPDPANYELGFSTFITLILTPAVLALPYAFRKDFNKFYKTSN